MDKEYSIDQTTYGNLKKGIYTPVSVRILNDGGKKARFPWERIFVDRKFDRGTPVYIVTFKSEGESDSRAFLSESVARKFLRSLAEAIRQKQGDNVFKFLDEIPLDNSVDFIAGTDNFTVTLSKTEF